MKITGLRLTILGLILGLSIGLGIQALKARITTELESIFSEETTKSTGCSFKMGKVNVSLLTLSASVKDPRIECNGKRELWFESIRAKFQLASIKKKRVWLDVSLIRGHANQVDDESVVTKFITSLTSPSPNSNKNQDRWKIKLRKLRMINSSFTQSFGEISLEGTGAQILMLRDELSNFKIFPKIETLTAHTKDLPFPPVLKLGTVDSEMYLDDHKVTISKLELQSPSGGASLRLNVSTSAGGPLDGSGTFIVNSSNTFIGPFLNGVFGGALTYKLENRIGDGVIEVKNSNDNKVKIRPSSSVPIIEVDKLESKLGLKHVIGHGSATEISQLSLSGEHVSIEVDKPLKLTGPIPPLGGQAKIELKDLALSEGLHLTTKGVLSISQNENKRLKGDLKLDNLILNGSTLGPMEISAERTADHILALNIVSLAAPNTITGQAIISLKPVIRLESSNLSIKELPIKSIGGELNARLILNGDFEPLNLFGDGEISLTKDGKTLLHTLIESNGSVAKIKITDKGIKGVVGETTLRFPEGGSINSILQINNPDLSLFSPELSCVSLDASANYKSSFDLALKGDGAIDIRSLAVGCAPYTITQDQAVSIPINGGKARLSGLTLKNSSSSLKVSANADLSGPLSGEASATLDLNTLLSLLPDADHLSGRTDASIKIGGTLGSPVFTGKASLYDGEIEIEDGMISARDIDGNFKLQGDSILVENLQGIINGGTLSATGSVLLNNFSNSLINATLSNVNISPTDNSSIQASSNITLKRGDDGLPLIAGTIELIAGELRENFDLIKMIRDYALGLFSNTQTFAATTKKSDINLDLKLKGDRNLYLITNFADGEFDVDLNIKGSLESPTIEGDVNTLSGWVGLRNRRFDISSGRLRFDPISSIPFLEIFGEASFPATSGELVLVFLEVKGPINALKFNLSSDLPYSEEALLALITQSGVGFTSTRANSRRSAEEEYGSGLLEDFASLNISRFVKNLTSLDSLGIEPIYNPFSGLVEPAFVAEKRIAKRLRLQGESTISSVSALSRAKLIYDLLPNISLWGSIQSDPTKNNPPIEGNVVFTALARQQRYLSTTILGNKHFSSDELLERLRITSVSRFPESNLPNLVSSLRSYYEDQGYLKNKVDASCPTTTEGICRELLISINEGERHVVGAVTLEGESLSGKIPESKIQELFRFKDRQPATEHFKTVRADDFLNTLRAEGYLQARTSGRYSTSEKDDSVNLIIKLTIGTPITFAFEGNTIFSDLEFLNSINLFGRKQPFGNNTTQLLLRNIESMYRKAGYLFATAYFDLTKDTASQREIITFKITEEGRLPVSEVKFTSLSQISEDQLKLEVLRIDRDLVELIFSPKFGVTEEIQSNSAVITQALVQLGFPYATANGDIIVNEGGDSISIEYLINEGERILIDKIDIVGLDGITLSDLPPAPKKSTIQDVNKYIESIRQGLKDLGYLKSSVNLEGTSEGQYNLVVSPGEITKITSISISGAGSFNRQMLFDMFGLSLGEPWDENKISIGKRRLLSSGLFSKVEVSTQDGKLDQPQEALLLNLAERPLQTFEIGFGANSEYGLHLFNEASDRSFFSDGRSLALRLDGYYQVSENDISQGVANLRYHDPIFINENWTQTEDIRFQRLDLTTLPYDLDRILLSSLFTRTNSTGYGFTVGHLLSQENLDNVKADAIVGEDDTGTVFVSALTTGFSIDQRNSPLNPTSGYYLSLEGKIASPLIGSEAYFGQLSLKATTVSEISERFPDFSIALAANAGIGRAFGETDQIPISFRYFTGGRTSVRGFKENSLGDRGDNGSVIGGDLLMGTNAELRYDLSDSIETHLFFDSGSVFLEERSPSIGDLRYSSGVGVRYRSPIGPIGLDLGAPIDREDGESPYRIHFSIGSMF